MSHSSKSFESSGSRTLKGAEIRLVSVGLSRYKILIAIFYFNFFILKHLGKVSNTCCILILTMNWKEHIE